jgi:murein DD-endopeptidase MepM/ murein hydrolase activator NlpD
MRGVIILPIPRVAIYRRGLGATFVAPVSGRVSSDFGPRPQPTAGASTEHKGIDYAVPVGTPVGASAAGSVIFAGVQSGYGNVVQVDHGGGIVSTYAHLSEIDVSKGDSVDAGDTLGLSGATGTVTGPNLHFGISVNGVYVDPQSYLVQASLPNVVPTATDSGTAAAAAGDVTTVDTLPDLSSVTTGVLDDPLTLGLALGAVGLVALVVLS